MKKNSKQKMDMEMHMMPDKSMMKNSMMKKGGAVNSSKSKMAKGGSAIKMKESIKKNSKKK